MVVVAGLVVEGAVVVELSIYNSLVGGISKFITVWWEGANKRREASFGWLKRASLLYHRQLPINHRQLPLFLN